MTILVTGATGNVGRHLTATLHRGGYRVRALTRDPAKAAFPGGVEVVGGDLADPASLDTAFAGVTAVHLITPHDATPEWAAELAERAAKAGVRRSVILWNGFNDPLREAAEATGLEWTVLEAGEYMSNALGWAESIRAEGVVREPFGDARSSVVHPYDVAEVAAAALTGEGHAERAYAVSGPEALTLPERVALLGGAIGRELSFVELSHGEAVEQLVGKGIPAETAEYVIGWHADPPAMASAVAPTVREVTGGAGRTFAEWARENAAAFGRR